MEKNDQTLGQRLCALREQCGYTQDELAEKLDVSRQTISNWENDKVKLDVSKAAEICRLYGVSMDELFLDEAVAPAGTPVNNVRKRLLFIAGFALALLLAIVSIVLFSLSGDGEASSVIYLGKSFIWGILSLCGAVLCAVFTVAIYRAGKK